MGLSNRKNLSEFTPGWALRGINDMTDIIDKIRQFAPSAIDQFATDMDRRRSLDDFKIGRILRDIFSNINVECLDPEMTFRYQRIKARLS